MFDRFRHGVCYYPEHWDASRHESDIRRIADAGFDYIRIAEGAWAYFEPKEGQFRFDLFDRVLELCDQHHVDVVMGTPTYTAPAWVSGKYPEVLRWDYNRIPMRHGSRRNFTYSSAKYIELSDRICTAMAEHFAEHPRIIAWQLDNEFNCHMDVSYAPSDTLAFRKWVKERYKTLDALNAAWGTAFWSMTYDDWNQIDLPHPTSAYRNPSILLDESRFISAMVVRFAKRQGGILHKHNRDWLITTNGLFGNINGPDLARVLTFFSHDQYPLFGTTERWWETGGGLVQARSLSFPYAILEQQSGPGGQMQYLHRSPRPGQVRLWAWQSIAHGAKMLGYFRWRTCPYGAEQHWHGLIDQDDRDTTRLAEAKRLDGEVKALPVGVLDAPPVKAIAVARQYESETNAARIDTYTHEGNGEPRAWVHAAQRRALPVDFIWPMESCEGYKMVVAPHLKLIDQDQVNHLTKYVRAGGTLVIGAQSGLKDFNNHIVELPLPGLWREPAGVEIEQWSTLDKGDRRSIQLPDGRSIEAVAFVEKLRPLDDKTEILAHWLGGDTLLAGGPAITRRKLGKGFIIYVGAYVASESVPALLDLLADELELLAPVGASESVEVIERTDGKKRWLWLLNHSAGAQTVRRVPPATNLLSGEKVVAHTLTLRGHDVAILALD